VDAHGVKAASLTFACATTAEERVARRAGLRAVRVDNGAGGQLLSASAP